MLVPIKSYYKSTMVYLYDNEGEPNWSIQKLNKFIRENSECAAELKKTKYNVFQKRFTAEQVKIIFKYMGHPMLNMANRKLLKIKNNLLDYFEQHPDKINTKKEQLIDLSPIIINDLGLIFENGKLLFTENEKYFFTIEDDFFTLYEKNSLKSVKNITDTSELITTLLELRKN